MSAALKQASVVKGAGAAAGKAGAAKAGVAKVIAGKTLVKAGVAIAVSGSVATTAYVVTTVDDEAPPIVVEAIDHTDHAIVLPQPQQASPETPDRLLETSTLTETENDATADEGSTANTANGTANYTDYLLPGASTVASQRTTLPAAEAAADNSTASNAGTEALNSFQQNTGNNAAAGSEGSASTEANTEADADALASTAAANANNDNIANPPVDDNDTMTEGQADIPQDAAADIQQADAGSTATTGIRTEAISGAQQDVSDNLLPRNTENLSEMLSITELSGAPLLVPAVSPEPNPTNDWYEWQGRWMVAPYVSLDRSRYSVDELDLLQANQSNYNLVLNAQSTDYTVGARAAVRVAPYLWAESGILYSSKAAIKGTVDVLSDTGLHIGTAQYNLSGRYLEIPLAISVRSNNGQFGWYARMGVHLAYNMQSDSSFYSYNNYESYTQQRIVPSMQTMNMTIMFGAGVEYNISKTLRFYAEPSFRQSLRPVINHDTFSNIPLNPHWSTLGLGVGVNYYFGNRDKKAQ